MSFFPQKTDIHTTKSHPRRQCRVLRSEIPASPLPSNLTVPCVVLRACLPAKNRKLKNSMRCDWKRSTGTLGCMYGILLSAVTATRRDAVYTSRRSSRYARKRPFLQSTPSALPRPDNRLHAAISQGSNPSAISCTGGFFLMQTPKKHTKDSGTSTFYHTALCSPTPLSPSKSPRNKKKGNQKPPFNK
jgi:hypothetical protein